MRKFRTRGPLALAIAALGGAPLACGSDGGTGAPGGAGRGNAGGDAASGAATQPEAGSDAMGASGQGGGSADAGGSPGGSGPGDHGGDGGSTSSGGAETTDAGVGGAGGASGDELVTTLVVGSKGGKLLGHYGASLIIPSGALNEEVTISLERDSTDSPALENARELGAAGSVYALLPHGTHFAKKVTVQIPFDRAQVPDPSAVQLLKAEPGGSFEPIPSTIVGNSVVGEVEDFSWVMAGFTASRPRIVYALAYGTSGIEVRSYPFDVESGALRSPTSSKPLGLSPSSLALHPSGRFLFVANAAAASTQNGIASDSIATFPVSLTSGSLGAMLGDSVPLGAGSSASTRLVVHPSGKFLYAAIDQGLTAGSIVRLAIRATDGALTSPTVVLTGPSVTPRAFAFGPAGTVAYVTSEYTPGGAGQNYQLLSYAVDAQGNFGAQLGSAAIGQDYPSAVVVNPTGQFVYATTQDGYVSQFRVGATGVATAAGSVALTGKPLSLAVDSLGKFLYAGRYNNLSIYSYGIDATSGALTQLGSGLAGCSQGACAQPNVVTADPQGDFVFTLNGSELSTFALDRKTGALTSKSSQMGFTNGGNLRLPGLFAVGGKSPLWLNRCTSSCALPQDTFSSGPTPPMPPTPTPTTAILTVARGTWGGHVTSSPGGIDYGDTVDQNHFAAEFPIGTIVSLRVTPPGNTGQGYDVVWLGDCSGTGTSTAVTISGDKQCMVDLRPVSTR